jgi:plastocyanin
MFFEIFTWSRVGIGELAMKVSQALPFTVRHHGCHRIRLWAVASKALGGADEETSRGWSTTALRISGLTTLVFMMGFSLALPIMPARAATNHVIEMTDYAFTPQFITINGGDSVQWYNNGSVAHTATANASDPMQWTDVVLSPTQHSGMITLTISGVYNYICTYHIGLDMWGRITVTGTTVPEFSGELFVVVGLMAMMFGLMAFRTRKTR